MIGRDAFDGAVGRVSNQASLADDDGSQTEIRDPKSDQTERDHMVVIADGTSDFCRLSSVVWGFLLASSAL